MSGGHEDRCFLRHSGNAIHHPLMQNQWECYICTSLLELINPELVVKMQPQNPPDPNIDFSRLLKKCVVRTSHSDSNMSHYVFRANILRVTQNVSSRKRQYLDCQANLKPSKTNLEYRRMLRNSEVSRISRGSLWEFHKDPWITMEIHGKTLQPCVSNIIAWIFIENPRVSLDHHWTSVR